MLKMSGYQGWGGRGMVLGGLSLGFSLGMGVGFAGPAMAQLQRSDDRRVPDVVVGPDEQIIGEVPEIDLTQDLLTPGFMLPMANRDVQSQINDFNQHLERQDWGSAFRVLSELGDSQLQAMVPVGDNGEHVAVKEQLQRQLLSLPPAGQRAFRQYFDGQAREMFARVQNHPLPGSDEQLMLTQAIVDRLLASSVGGQAAILLGDLYFERGIFNRAEQCWALALEHGMVTGQDATMLQAKRVLALQRAGDQAGATTLLSQLQARFDRVELAIGGEEVDALAVLAQTLEQGTQDTSNADGTTLAGPVLPQENATPSWNMQFLNQRNVVRMNTSDENRYYRNYAPNYMVKFVPEAVADEQHVYFQWLGAVFALDRDKGRIAWHVGSVQQAAEQVQNRRMNNTGDIRNYHIAVSRDALLVTSAPIENQADRFILTAYDKQTGRPMWNSTAANGWSVPGPGDRQSGVSMLGEVLVTDAGAYCVVRPNQASECFLRRFDPATGVVEWTLPLGSGDAIGIANTEIRRMPQPRLVMGDLLLYVLTNNGALIAVDPAAAEIRWALRTQPPVGVGENNNYYEDPNAGNTNNPNGADGLILRNGVLYAKEHNARTLYAVNPDNGQVNWSLANLRQDARLVGVDDEHIYLMHNNLETYRNGGDRRQLWHTRNVAGAGEQGAAMVVGDQILWMNDQRLNLIQAENGSQAGNYGSSNLLGANGGRLYLFDDLLVCLSTTDITAFHLAENEGN